jgi:outer membrane immunogenic protein
MRWLLVALALVAFVPVAFAADYPVPVLRGSDDFVPATPQYYPWDGFYFGGQVTYGNADADFTTSSGPLVAFALRNTVLENEQDPSQYQVLGHADTGAAGVGAFIGYNTQWDSAILGVDFNYTHSSFNAVASSYPIDRLVSTSVGTYDVDITSSGSMHIEDFGVLRARFGFAAANFMPYATLGFAVGRADLSLSATVAGTQTLTSGAVSPYSFTQSQSKDSVFLYGYAAGGGLDVALTPNIFARGEYEFIQWAPVWQINSHLNIVKLGLGVKM